MEKYRISSRIQRFRPSLTLALKTCVNERREQGLPVYDFGLGSAQETSIGEPCLGRFFKKGGSSNG